MIPSRQAAAFGLLHCIDLLRLTHLQLTKDLCADSKIALWLLGMGWAWGFIGVWGPVTTYTAEMYPTRIRGVGNGFSWSVAFLVGAVLWPFVSVWLRETTGSFVASA